MTSAKGDEQNIFDWPSSFTRAHWSCVLPKSSFPLVRLVWPFFFFWTMIHLCCGLKRTTSLLSPVRVSLSVYHFHVRLNHLNWFLFPFTHILPWVGSGSCEWMLAWSFPLRQPPPRVLFSLFNLRDDCVKSTTSADSNMVMVIINPKMVRYYHHRP